MEKLKNQTNNLKLNVSNINSYLINSNKQLKTLKLKNRNFARREVQKQSRIQRERKLESPLKGITGVFSNIASKAKTPFRSIFDKLFEFFTIIATGVIINKLPQIISAVSDFFKNNKWIFDGLSFVFNAIGNGINGVINLVNFLTQPKKKEIEENLNDIDKQFDNINRELDVDLSNLPSEPISEGDEQTTRRADDPNIMSDGSVIRIGDMVGGPDFAPPEPTKIQPLKKYARGGLVSGNKSTDVSGRLAEKQALKRSDYFTRYASTIKSNNTVFKLTRENREKFGDTVDSIIRFERYLMNQEKEKKEKNKFTSFNFKKYSKQSNNILDASGEPGVDFTPNGPNNLAVFPGDVVEIGHDYNPNIVGGDNRQGSGYGNYVVVRSIDPKTQQKFDGLYAHFPDGEIKVSVGSMVKKGDILGRMATAAEFADPNTRPRVGSGDGAHTSLDFFEPGSTTRYGNWTNLVPLIDTFGDPRGNPHSGGMNINDFNRKRSMIPISLNRNIGEDIYSESETIALQRVYIIKNNTIPMPIPLA
jgi:hypothetical protein